MTTATTASLWFLSDARLREAIEQALSTLAAHLPHVERLTFAGLEQGVPVLEARASAPLPERLVLAGGEGCIYVRSVAEPIGCVLHVSA